MKEAVGGVTLYNIIIIFIVLTFGFLMATISYVKAFRVNNKIAHSIEKFEGYNSLSEEEILKNLSTYGYQTASGNFSCPTRVHYQNGSLKTYMPVASTTYKKHRYCVYQYDARNGYYQYGIVTYISFDIPLVGGKFQIPVYSETDSIFNFSA
jgi:hypothetical protein